MQSQATDVDALLPRRTWLKLLGVLAAAGASEDSALPSPQQSQPPETRVTPDMLEHALELIGLSYTPEQRALMLPVVNRQLENCETIRGLEIDYDVEPAFVFTPLLPGRKAPQGGAPFPDYTRRPALPRSSQSVEELAFATVTELGPLLRERRVSSTDLTKMYLERLKKYSPALLCVITLTEDLALEQAAQADREIAAGKYRGPLHGVPWGAKDLFATKGIPTTWGAEPFRTRVPDHDAAIVERLRDAGAVLLAKLSMGELARGGQWFAGMTKNPWDLEQSSSGSSAGSAVASSAGLAGFTIGTETLGSITSPSERCGATGLRPTFGRVSRYGAMALSWTMDKVGPICRSVEDCAIVFEAIRGTDERDRSTIQAAFEWTPERALGDLRIGVLRQVFDTLDPKQKPVYDEALRVLAAAGARLQDTDFPKYLPVLRTIIESEGAAAFDPLTRSGGLERLRGQEENSWPNVFRAARLIPAAEYINIQRARTLLMREIDALMANWDVLVLPPNAEVLGVGNLTGIPEVSVPCGFEGNHPLALRFIAPLFQEGLALRAALAFEQSTKWHTLHPPMNFA